MMTPRFKTPDSLFPGTLFSYYGMCAKKPVHVLYKDEQDLVQRAIGKRQGEFAAGRLCARLAMRQMGVTLGPLLADKFGAPVWPSDISGSISHTTGFIMAVVARAQMVRGVGIDVEHRHGLPELAVVRHICGTGEQAWLASFGKSGQQLLAALLLFSAKESVIKCVYNLTGERLSLADSHIEVNLADGSWIGCVGSERAATCRLVLMGRMGWTEHHVFTAVWKRA